MADIKNTEEILDAAISVTTKLKEVLADGEISWVEGVKLAVSEAPEIIAAVSGVGELKGEWKDLDKAELEVIAEKAMQLSKAIAALFSK